MTECKYKGVCPTLKVMVQLGGGAAESLRQMYCNGPRAVSSECEQYRTFAILPKDVRESLIGRPEEERRALTEVERQKAEFPLWAAESHKLPPRKD